MAIILNDKDEEMKAEDVDLSKGYLKTETRTIHHDAVPAIEPVTHQEIVKTYYEDDGETVKGNDVKIVVDDPGQEARDAYDEQQTFQRYILYTESEREEWAKQQAEQAIVQAQGAQQSVLNLLTARMLTRSATDEEIMNISTFLPHFDPSISYQFKDVIMYKGIPYRALQNIKANSPYTPDTSPSLWKRIGAPNSQGIYPWIQPVGSSDVYMKGDKVTYNEKTWESIIDNNVWEPGIYGWNQIN